MENKPNSAGVPVLDQFVGLSGAGSLVVGSNITAISGATITSRAVVTEVQTVINAAKSLG